MPYLILSNKQGTGAPSGAVSVNFSSLSADSKVGLTAVAISNNYAIIGAPLNDDEGSNAGRAYIVELYSGNVLHTLTNPDTGSPSGDRFGNSVGITDTYAIVGAPYDNSLSGNAYIYDTVTGGLLHTIGSRGLLTGIGVDITDTHAIIGAGSAGYQQTGNAYVYNPSTGVQLPNGHLSNPNTAGTPDFDMFGYATALTDTYAIVGARAEDLGASGAGAVYQFNLSTGAYIRPLQQATPYLSEAYGGEGISADGNIAVVGSYKDRGPDNLENSGQVYVFDLTTGNRMYTLENPNPYGTREADLFGRSVSIKGDYIVAGAQAEDADGVSNTGRVYVYHIPSLPTYSGSEITVTSATHVIENPNQQGTMADDQFGRAVATNGTHMIVSAPNEDSATATSTGAAYIFDLTTL